MIGADSSPVGKAFKQQIHSPKESQERDYLKYFFVWVCNRKVQNLHFPSALAILRFSFIDV